MVEFWLDGNILYTRDKLSRIPQKGEHVWFIPENEWFIVKKVSHVIYRVDIPYTQIHLRRSFLQKILMLLKIKMNYD